MWKRYPACASLTQPTTPSWQLHADLQRNFRVDLLPGGRHCLQHWLAPECRPFMGPNLFVSPPGPHTWFHEDGGGDVDSGHMCLDGTNEVVILRRMSTRHKQRALNLLAGDSGEYDLCLAPHDRTQNVPGWTASLSPEKLATLKYVAVHSACPSRAGSPTSPTPRQLTVAHLLLPSICVLCAGSSTCAPYACFSKGGTIFISAK